MKAIMIQLAGGLVVALAVLTFAGVSPEQLDRGHVVNVLRAKNVPDSLIAATEGLPIVRIQETFIRLSEDGQTAMIVCVDSCATRMLFDDAGAGQ